jgi:hypothetical protein
MNQAAAAHLKSVDAILEGLIDKIGPITIRARRVPVFQSLVHAIIYQQLHSKAADAILSRFEALFSDGHFPSAQQVLSIDLERLRTAGLSRPKANYIRGIAEMAVSGSLPTLKECDKLEDAEIVQRLMLSLVRAAAQEARPAARTSPASAASIGSTNRTNDAGAAIDGSWGELLPPDVAKLKTKAEEGDATRRTIIASYREAVLEPRCEPAQKRYYFPIILSVHRCSAVHGGL